jgi:predicted small integral membrane protein
VGPNRKAAGGEVTLGIPATTVRALHLVVGVGGVLAFLGTGAYMATHFPAAYQSDEAIRYLYRANHVYLLLGSLVNIAVGIYRTDTRPGWRGIVGLAGSALLLVALPVLLYAFFFEAPVATPERAATFFGVLMLLIGALAQWPNRASR